MKIKYIILIVAIVFTLPIFAEEITLPHVTVYGTATSKVVPDLMVWFLNVTNTGPQLPAIAEAHNNNIQQVLSFLKKTGLPEQDIQTSRMQFGENLVRRDSNYVKEGYFASTDISFSTKALEKYKAIWLGFAEKPGVTVKAVYYDYSKRIESRNSTRKEAVLAARTKAMDLAKALGAEIAEPLLIEEELEYVPQGSENSYITEKYADDGTEKDFALGTISIRITIKTTFRLVPVNK